MCRFKIVFIVFAAVAFVSCGLIRRQKPEDGDLNAQIVRATQKPMPPEKTKKLLNEVGSNWLYGQGMGETALNIGTAVIFPPYLIYLVGNAALSLSGYEPITVSRMLPEKAGDEWRETYDSVTAGPGKMAAAMAGEEYRNAELAKGKIKEIITPESESAKGLQPAK